MSATDTQINRRVVLAKRPTAEATLDCFALDTQAPPALQSGQVRVAVEFVSVDAAARTMLRGEGFHTQVGLGEVILANAVGRIVESAAPDWPLGQIVRGGLGAQTLATLDPRDLIKITNDDTTSNLPLSVHLGALGGSTGYTAWIGVRKVAKPKPGDVFVVSAAAGAVGSVAGQIAKLDGARVIGIASGERKTGYLTDTLGFDAAIDYKNEDLNARLRELAPDGVNVFFDNVGGDILDAVLDNIAMRSKVVICGAISQYDNLDNVTGPSLYLRLAERQSSMEGFAYFHFPESFEAADRELRQWLADGSLTVAEEVFSGIESYPEALLHMFAGGNLGKLLVKVT